MSLLKEPAAEEGQYVTKIHIDEKMERRGKVVWGRDVTCGVWGAVFAAVSAGLSIIEVESGPKH